MDSIIFKRVDLKNSIELTINRNGKLFFLKSEFYQRTGNFICLACYFETPTKTFRNSINIREGYAKPGILFNIKD